MIPPFLGLRRASRQERGDIERPAKKIRQTHTCSSIYTVDMVNSLTGKGIETFKQSNFVEAEAYFSQALCRIDVEHLCHSIQASMNNAVTNALPAESCNEHGDDVKIGSYDVSVESDELRSGSSTETKPFKYVCQRHEYDEGMDLYQDPESVHDTFDADSISARLLYNIGLTKMRLGQYESALSVFEKTLSKIRSSCEKNSQLLLQVLHKMGYAHYRCANNAKASRHYGQALTLAIHESLNKSTVAACLNCLGVIHFHFSANDTEKLLRLFKQSLSLYRECLGSKLKEIATVLNNIGRVYYLRCEYENALEIYDEALSIRTKILGEDSLDAAATTYNHAQTYHRLGRLDDALVFYSRFIAMIKSSQGSNDRDVAIVYRCMGEIHHERGEEKEALILFKDALKAGKNAHTKFHPEVASTLNKLGNICYEMKDSAAALRYYREGLEVENVVLAPEHPHVIITLTNIAHILKQRCDYAGALRAYTQVHEKQMKVLSPNSMELAVTLSSIGLVQYHLSMFDESFDSYQEALRIRRENFGTDEHADIASTFNSIGLVLFKQDVYEMAKECFEQSLKIRTKLLGKDHRDTAILWYNLATINFEQGQEEVAIQMYKETLRVERVALGNDHPDVVLTIQHIGQVLQQVGNLDGALQYFVEALQIVKKKQQHDVAAANLLNLIGNIYLQQGKVDRMMKSFIEASRILGSDRTESLVIAGYNFYGLSKTNPPCAALA